MCILKSCCILGILCIRDTVHKSTTCRLRVDYDLKCPHPWGGWHFPYLQILGAFILRVVKQWYVRRNLSSTMNILTIILLHNLLIMSLIVSDLYRCRECCYCAILLNRRHCQVQGSFPDYRFSEKLYRNK